MWLLELCIAKGAAAGAADSRGWTALHYAAASGHTSAVRVLVGAMQAAQIDLHVKDGLGSTPTQLAARGKHMQLVTLLLEATHGGAASGPGCSAQQSYALHLAAQHGLDAVSSKAWAAPRAGG